MIKQSLPSSVVTGGPIQGLGMMNRCKVSAPRKVWISRCTCFSLSTPTGASLPTLHITTSDNTCACNSTVQTIDTSSVHFSSVQDGICTLRKAHICSTPSLRSFPNVGFETVPMFIWVMTALSCPFKENCLALPLSTLLSSRQLMVCVMSSALCPQVVSQDPQHYRSSEEQATSEDCFACQSVCSVVSLHSGMSRAVHPQVFLKADVDH